MSVNWSGGGGRTAGGEGILRGGASTANREELLVFGYSCKLFRDDERAREVDQGRLLIPWAGDDALRIDRYDARGALHELASLEAPPGGHDWRLELTDAERRVEQLCDEERYRALYCDEDEELMYKEEELKRLRAAGYGQIGFNYDAVAPSNDPPPPTDQADADEPFTPTPEMQALLTPDIPLPETQKLNAIIEKTATFIARHGAQMEILLRAKQAGNAQFDFLDKERPLHRYYRVLLDAVRNDKLTQQQHKHESELKPDENEDYLHPSLAAPLIESAPSIPSIHYKPSADCDYTMLISRIKGTREEEPPEPAVPAGELAPPGTQPLTLPAGDQSEHDFNIHYYQYYDPPPAHAAHITRAPVLYAANAQPERQLAYLQYPPPPEPPPPPAAPASAPGSAPGSGPPSPPAPGALNLMHYYNSGSESEHSDNEESPLPPPDVQLIISKMAAYVARNGDEFRDIVRAKNDPRFTFLEEGHPHHKYYMRLMLEKRGGPPPAQAGAHDTTAKRDDKKKAIAPVSFSIKKLKEPESLLPKPALPYESSDDDKDPGENDNANKTTDNVNKPAESTNSPETPVGTTSLEPSSQEPTPKPVTATLNNKVEVAIADETFTFVPPVENSVKKSDEKSKRSEEKLERKRKKDKKRRENGESKKSKRDGSRTREKRVRSRSREKKERSSSKEKKPRSRSREKERSHSKDKKEQSGSLESKDRSDSRDTKERSHSRDRKKRSRSLEKKERSRSIEMKQRSPSREKKDRSHSEERVKQSREEKKEGSKSREGKGEKEKAEVVITIGDRSDDELIDLTGDLSDGRGEAESNGDRSKQTERKRRAAAFLAAVGRDATAVHPPPVIEDNTLASAMVKTLVELRAKKEAAEERQRRRERQKHRQRKREEAQESSRDRDRSHRKSKRRKHRSSSDERDDGYNESSSKRRKHRKEKKHSSSSKSKRRKRSEECSRESSKARERRRSESPHRRKNSTETAQEETKKKEEENAKKKSDFDAEAIKNKLKMLREESDEELEVKRWRAESHESEPEKKKKEYSEGELESSDDKSSSSCGSSASE